MKCRVERNWVNNQVKVWLYTQGMHGSFLYDPADPRKSIPIHEGEAVIPPSLELPEEALRALVAEASDVLPASDATTAHLNDAVRVRDRLLTLIEETSGER